MLKCPCLAITTVAHEQAHQLGYAREQEANYLAFVHCIEQKNPTYNTPVISLVCAIVTMPCTTMLKKHVL